MQLTSGRIQGRQAQMIATAGSVTVQIAKPERPPVKTVLATQVLIYIDVRLTTIPEKYNAGTVVYAARTRLTATPLGQCQCQGFTDSEAVARTYIKPSPNTPPIAIFCLLSICKIQTIRIGSTKIVRSIAALRYPIIAA